MATRVAIAIMREQAFNGIAEATAQIATALGIDAPVIPTQGKDADLLNAQQLTAIADYLGHVAAQIGYKEPSFVQDVSDDLPPEKVAENVPVVENDPPAHDDAPKPRRKGR
ncbi:MAG: hypothetical protein LC130_23200 [Bryobacterales bacterium]|nr:hypothetical protein [Bryobacterales bacterium]